jgi:hypothetical protein
MSAPAHPLIVITHDIDKVEHIDYILVNLQNLYLGSFLNAYVFIYSSKSPVSSEVLDIEFKKLDLATQKHCGVKLQRIYSMEEKNKLYQQYPRILQFESNMLLSQQWCRFLKTNAMAFQVNIFVPIIKYVYNHKIIEHNNKKFTVKNFMKSNDQWFQAHALAAAGRYNGPLPQHIPTDRERLHVSYELLPKINGFLPSACPSPYMHDWKKFVHLVYNSSIEHEEYLPFSHYAIHSFSLQEGPDESL